MSELFQNLDLQTLFFINGTATHPWLDWFFLNVTDLNKNPIFSGVTILLMVYFGYRKYGKQVWRLVVAMALTIAVGDMLGYRVLKKTIERARPYQNETLSGRVIGRKEGHGNSFPSNHAINCFGGATILATAFPGVSYIFYIFAAIIGYSRIYLGVHYPSDVLAGALLGVLVALAMRYFLMNQLKTFTGPKS